jgi:hypothetical protein
MSYNPKALHKSFLIFLENKILNEIQQNFEEMKKGTLPMKIDHFLKRSRSPMKINHFLKRVRSPMKIDQCLDFKMGGSPEIMRPISGEHKRSLKLF